MRQARLAYWLCSGSRLIQQREARHLAGSTDEQTAVSWGKAQALGEVAWKWAV